MPSRKSTRRRASSSFVDKRKTRPSSTLRDSAAANGSAIETAGEIFSDGTIIEILRDPASLEGFSLVRSQRGVLDLKSTLSHAGRVYVPICVERSISKAVRFPTQVAPPESTKKLFTVRKRESSAAETGHIRIDAITKAELVAAHDNDCV